MKRMLGLALFLCWLPSVGWAQSAPDGAGYVAGATALMPAGCVRDDTSTGTLAEDKLGIPRCNTNREMLVTATPSQKATYSAGTTASTATAAGTGPFFTICGSSTKTMRVQWFNVNGTVATAAIRAEVVLKKTSTATSLGTATALTQAPHDSNSAAGTASLVNFYTALATAGTSVGVVGSRFKVWPITATIAATDFVQEAVFDFSRHDETEGIVLRGTAQCLEASFGTTTTNAPTLELAVTWTEE